MEERKEQLLAIISKSGLQGDNVTKACRLIDEICFMEDQLIELRKLPFININPKNPMQQKATPASKLYKETMQQYNNSLRLLFRISGDLGGDDEDESPLRKWVRERKE